MHRFERLQIKCRRNLESIECRIKIVTTATIMRSLNCTISNMATVCEPWAPKIFSTAIAGGGIGSLAPAIGLWYQVSPLHMYNGNLCLYGLGW